MVEILGENVCTMLLEETRSNVMRDCEKQCSKTSSEMNNAGEKAEINKHGKVLWFLCISLGDICILVSSKTRAFKKLLRQCHVLLKLQISITKNLEKDKSK